MNKSRVILLFATLLAGLAFVSPARANLHFSWGNEDGQCGADAPHPPYKPWDFRKDATPRTICAPDGNRYLEWVVADHQHDAYVQIHPGNFPISAEAGRTFYLAFRVNFTRLNGKDVWCNTPDQKAGECFDKFIELRGGSGLRWIVLFGEKGMKTPHERFSTFMGSFSHGLNRDVEEWGAYYQNHNGYSRFNPKLLEYERWYNVVMAVKMASDRSGSIALYIDGEKILEYENIKTMEPDSKIERIDLNGTFAQPSYKINAHIRKLGHLLLTDNRQEIVGRGYLRSPDNPTPDPADARAFPPAAEIGAGR